MMINFMYAEKAGLGEAGKVRYYRNLRAQYE
jgi:hypothetical protein